MPNPRLLLHVCCGVCSSYVPELLLPEFDVTVYYENSNLYPSAEFDRRRDAAATMADRYGLPFIEAPYGPAAWTRSVAGMAQEPERGKRCVACIRFRLDRTFAYAKGDGFDTVATTLSVSRRKDADMINAVGEGLAERYGIPFLGRDWKKKAGADISEARAKAAGIYRQSYCGCVYSLVASRR
ncbi:epoxyqueuosine reductase QueH [Candidatus Uhrbacteria bacterium]|nr:epoxyqueuosine reductase QueH [Candidatus Uhrbacteria bacterium]